MTRMKKKKKKKRGGGGGGGEDGKEDEEFDKDGEMGRGRTKRDTERGYSGSTAYSVGAVYGGKERLYTPDVCPALVATLYLAPPAIILSMTSNWWRPARLTPEHGHFSHNLVMGIR